MPKLRIILLKQIHTQHNLFIWKVIRNFFYSRKILFMSWSICSGYEYWFEVDIDLFFKPTSYVKVFSKDFNQSFFIYNCWKCYQLLLKWKQHQRSLCMCLFEIHQSINKCNLELILIICQASRSLLPSISKLEIYGSQNASLFSRKHLSIA